MTHPGGTDFVLRVHPGERLELTGPQVQVPPVAFGQLARVARQARRIQKAGRANRRFGQFFFAALPHALRQGLLQAAEHRQIGWPPRLLVVGDPTTRAQFLPWEALRFGVQEYPQATGRLRIVRWPGAQSLGLRPQRSPERWRVLVLVGDVRQAWGVDAAESALAKALTQIAESLGGPVDLHIAAPRWVVDRHPGLRWIPFDRLDELPALLRQSWHVVHFLGHSDGQEPASAMDTFAGYSGVAKHLLFQLDPAPDSPPAEWPITTLQQSLSRATRVLVLGACLTQEHLAAPLLKCVDHVVGNQAMVSPEVAADFCGPFYTALAGLQPVSSALAAAHAALFRSHPHAFWIPALWTRNLDDQPLLNPEDLALRAYSESVVRDMGVLSGPLTAGLSYDDILANIYVELEVLPDEQGRLRRGQSDKDPAEEARGPGAHWPHPTRPTLEQVVRLRQVGWFSGRYYLFGHAADGKTTALRHLNRMLALERLAQERPELLSVYTTLQQVVDTLRPNLGALTGEQVLQHVLRPVQEAPGRLQALRSQGQLVVLLDSLDEVADSDRDAARRVIDLLDHVLGQNVLIVASRAIGFVGRQDSQFRSIVLQGLLPEDRDALVRKWCDVLWRDRHNFAALRPLPSVVTFADALLTQIHRSPGLRHATTNPLTVALLVRVAADTEPRPGRPIAELPRRREVLYRICLRFLLGCRHRRQDPVPDAALEAGLVWLRRIALWLHEQGRTTVQRPNELQRGLGQRDQLVDELATWDARTLLVPGAPWGSVAEFRDWLEKSAGLFVDKGGGAYGFAPKVFQDALAAEALAEKHKHSAKKLVGHIKERLGAQPRDKLRHWGETLALLTSQLPAGQQRAWLDGLQQIDRALALRALAGAELDQDIVRGFFAWSEDAAERRKVIEELGAQIEDNEVLRPVVETLVGSTTDGEDLWHLDALLRGRGLPTEAIDARLLAMSAPNPALYVDHFVWVPPPMARSFRMDTPRLFHMDSRTIHLPMGFWVGRRTVTRAQYLEFDPTHVSRPNELAVTNVSWFQAVMFARWLDVHRRRGASTWGKLPGETSDLSIQLPTEGQWEWCARGEADHEALVRAGWSLSPNTAASWAAGNPAARQHPLGLRDLGGIWEWCADTDDHVEWGIEARRAGVHIQRFASLHDGRRGTSPDTATATAGFRLVLSPAQFKDG